MTDDPRPEPSDHDVAAVGRILDRVTDDVTHAIRLHHDPIEVPRHHGAGKDRPRFGLGRPAPVAIAM